MRFSQSSMRPIAVHGLVIVVLLTLFVFLQILCPFNEVWDDAFISLQYARNISHGLGPVFGPGEVAPAEGYSNPLWTFLLAFYFLLPGSVFVWIKISNLVAIVGLVIAGRVLLISVTERPPLILTYLPGFLISLDWSFFMYFTSGMETVAYSALVLGSLAHSSLVVTRSETRGLFLNATMWLGVALLRPEGILLAVPMAAVLTLRASLLSRRKDLAKWTLTLALGFSAFLLWRYSYYGDLLPNTYYAKVPTLGVYHLRKGVLYYLSGLIDGLSPAILLLAVVGLVYCPRNSCC